MNDFIAAKCISHMVLLAVIAEFQVNAARWSSADTSSTINFENSAIVVKKELSLRYKILARIALIEIMFGTVIWGYGDCFFKSCT